MNEQLTPDEALTVLQSALSACQSAGLLVMAANVDGTPPLTVPGAHYVADGSRAAFRLGAPELPKGALNKPDA